MNQQGRLVQFRRDEDLLRHLLENNRGTRQYIEQTLMENTPWNIFHFACYKNYYLSVCYCVSKGVDPNIVVVGSGRTALHLAAFNRHNRIIEYLLDNTEIDPLIQTDRNDDSVNAFFESKTRQTLALFLRKCRAQRLDRTRSRDGTPKLVECVSYEHIDDVRAFVESEYADLNVKNHRGFSSLHYSVIKENIDILALLLLSNRCFLDIQNREGKTPLHYAHEKNNQVMIQMLLDAGACPHVEDINGLIPGQQRQ